MRKNTLVQAKAVEQYDKSALVSNKDYPSLELVRLERLLVLLCELESSVFAPVFLDGV